MSTYALYHEMYWKHQFFRSRRYQRVAISEFLRYFENIKLWHNTTTQTTNKTHFVEKNSKHCNLEFATNRRRRRKHAGYLLEKKFNVGAYSFPSIFKLSRVTSELRPLAWGNESRCSQLLTCQSSARSDTIRERYARILFFHVFFHEFSIFSNES